MGGATIVPRTKFKIGAKKKFPFLCTFKAMQVDEYTGQITVYSFYWPKTDTTSRTSFIIGSYFLYLTLCSTLCPGLPGANRPGSHGQSLAAPISVF